MALLVLMGIDAKEAAGTAPLIVAAGCMFAFAVHAFDMTAGWSIVLASSLACLAGSQAGARFMSARMESRAIRALFTGVMILVGVVILVQAL